MLERQKSWEERLTLAEQVGCFTEDDKDAAACWTTCAVGETYPKLGGKLESYRSFRGVVPYDDIALQLHVSAGTVDRLEALGGSFYDYVAEDDLENARDTYEKIKAYVKQTVAPKVAKQIVAIVKATVKREPPLEEPVLQ